MNLIACKNCHTQYDVTQVAEKEITCRCGEVIVNESLESREAQVHRCGSCGAQVSADALDCGYCGGEIVRMTDSLSLICPECFGRNEENSRFCTACGVAFDPQKVDTGGHELPCPCCGRLMPVRNIGGLGVNECPECNGLWVPEEKFNLLIDRAIASTEPGSGVELRTSAPRVKGANPAQQRVVYRKCPICDAHMNRRNFRKTSGVIIDICSQHGTWLDADELERIAGFIQSGGRPQADRYMKGLEAMDSQPATSAAIARPVPLSSGDAWTSGSSNSTADLIGSALNLFVRLLD